MGQIVGAAIVSHHPGLMQCEEFRVLMGAGKDSDLIPGYDRLRQHIDGVKPDVIMIFDTHWFTTGYHLIDGAARYQGQYVSDEMPWYLHGVHYDYEGCPELAQQIEQVARLRGVRSRTVDHPGLERQYATINLVKKLNIRERVVSVSCCQNCRPEHYLQSGRVIGEAIANSDLRVVLLASGALSHKFNDIDWVPSNPRIFHEDNVSRPENVLRDKEAIALFEQGRHDLVLEQWEEKFKPTVWEGFGGHYLQMIGAMGEHHCTARGTALSEYENARGTGNIHMWFDVLGQERAQ